MSDCCVNGGCADGVSFEEHLAMCDIANIVNERGTSLTVKLHQESSVERDRLNSIKRKTTPPKTIIIKAFPINYAPTDKELQKTGMRERVQVVAHTAVYCWTIANEVNVLEDIDLVRGNVFVGTTKYEIKDKNLVGQIGPSYLYLVLGLNRV